MIIIVSNRNIVGAKPDSSKAVVGDENLFGENENEQGGYSELRVAVAKKVPVAKNDDDKWKVTLLPDQAKDGSTGTEELFGDTIEKIRSKKIPNNWVVFIHGFNQSLKKNLDKCKEISDYGVNVLAFSWPSNPGPNGGGFSVIKNKREEYRRARANARHSITAAERFMERLAKYYQKSVREDCHLSVNLLVHSLGNYLLQKSLEDPLFDYDRSIFDNIILHEADADHSGHASWVDNLKGAKRVYITHNVNDAVLKASTLVNGKRIGNSPFDLDANLPVYVDFSYGDLVGVEHRLFRSRVAKNPVIKKFFRRAFNGKPAENIEGLVKNNENGAFQLEERPGEGVFDEDF